MVIRQPLYAFSGVLRSRSRPSGKMIAIGASVAVHVALGAYMIAWTFHEQPQAAEIPDTMVGPFISLPKTKPPEPIKPLKPVTNRVHSSTVQGPINPETIKVTPTKANDTTLLPLPTLQSDTGQAELSAPPKTPAVIVEPNWLSRPTSEQVARAYPEEAIRSNISGKILLSCEVTATGSVAGCSVVTETPHGYGFGRAAIALSRYFRMKPRTEDGAPVGGALVRIPLKFAIEG